MSIAIVNPGSSSTLLSITTAAGGASLGTANTASSSAFPIVAGSNITLSQNSTGPAFTIIGPSGGGGGGGNVVQGSNLATSTGTIVFSGGNNITISTGASSIQIGEAANVSLATKNRLSEVNAAIATGSGTASQTVFGSSLFLEELYVPAQMLLSEVDMAFSFSFSTSATTSTYGSMNRSFVIYSYVNASTLSSVFSTTQGFAFGGSSTTQGAQSLMSQVAGGWTAAGGVIVPMTFASKALPAGQYVIGNLVAFSVASSASASMYGVALAQMTSSTLAATVFSAAPTPMSAITSGQLAAASAFSGTTNITLNSEAYHAGSALTALTQNSTNNISWFVSRASSAVTSVTSAISSFTFLEAPFVGGLGTTAGSIITGTTAVTALSASGYLAGSIVTNTIWGVGMSNAGTISAAPITSMTIVATAQAFNYLGASSVLTGGLSWAPFHYGLMSTGGIPAAITLTTGTANNLTTYGSTAALQPWWALIGA